MSVPTGWKRLAAWASAVVAMGAVLGCGGEGPAAAERAREPGPVRVVVSIPPLQGLVGTLAPEDAEVRVLIPPGRSPHGYEPTPADLAGAGRADLVVLVGMGIESGLPPSLLERAEVLEMAAALGIEGEGHDHAHDHGHDHAHDHAHDHGDPGSDPHLWLDPVLVEQFVDALTSEVSRAVERAGGDPLAVEARREALLADVRAVHEAYGDRLAAHAGAVLITQHAAWGRLADRYGLVIASDIQLAEQSEPSSARLAELVGLAEERGVQAVVSEPQLNRAVAERLAEQIGVPVAVLDPLGSGDWAGTMMANLEALERVLGEGPAGAAAEESGGG